MSIATAAPVLTWSSYRGHRIARRPSDGRIVIRFSTKREIIGTAGDIPAAKMFIDERVLRLMGDITEDVACQMIRRAA
jgi:NDP-sugar pyrophosphorylase family protein